MQLLTAYKEALSLSPKPDLLQERIVFAFNEKDRAQFFPFHHDGFPGGGDRHRLDTGILKSSDHWESLLREFRPTVIVTCWSTPPLPKKLLLSDDLPLRYLCHTTGTVRNVVPREFLVEGGLVTNWGNVISHNVAEQALLLILCAMRSITKWKPQMKSNPGCWGNGELLKTRSLRHKRVGLHGFGNIAIELLRLLAPFDVEIFAYSHNVPPAYMKEKGVTPCTDLKELFKNSDVLVECEALTPHSAGSVTKEMLLLLPEDSVFVNVGRGAVVDEAAMLRLGAEGRIRVACDVFQTEPMPINSPALEMDGVIISPHIAGPTGDWYHRCGDYALGNVNRYLEGQPLLGQVTLEVFDRST